MHHDGVGTYRRVVWVVIGLGRVYSIHHCALADPVKGPVRDLSANIRFRNSNK